MMNMALLAKLSSFSTLVLIFGLIGAISAKSVAQKPKVDSGADEECVLCEFLLKELDDYIGSNATEEKIKDALEKACSLLPTTLQDQCKLLMEDYAVIILDLLVKDVPPEFICTEIGLCKSNKKKQPLSIPGPQCVLCKMLMGKLADMLSANATEEEIKAALDKVCSLLPSTYKTECDEFVQKYTPEILKFLTQEVAPEAVCALLGLCSTPKITMPVVKAEVDGVSCALCEFVMEEVDKLLSDNSTEAEIEAALEKVCSLLPSTISSECDQFIEQYLTVLIQLLVNDISPKEICTRLTLCTSKAVQKPVLVTKPKVSPTQKVGDETCVLCEFVMKEVDSLLSDNATEAEIEAALEKVCSLLPDTISAECDQFVKQYLPVIVKLLVNTPPDQICTLLGLCTSKAVQQKPVVVTKPKVLPTQKVGDETCVLCEFVLKEVDSLLSDNATEAEIEAALEKVCSLLPATVSAECDQFIKQYLPVIVKLLVDTSPDQICTLLGLCTSKAVQQKRVVVNKPKVLPTQKVGDETCVLCEYIMKEVDSLLSDNATEEEIKKVVENICTILPGTLKEQCVSFLDTYATALITLLVQQLDPKVVCTALGLCNTTSKAHLPRLSDSPVKANPEYCAFCEFLMAELKDLISKNSTEEEIKKALDDVCKLLPGDLNITCLVFVNRYADAIIKLILMEIDPTQICTAIGFCQSIVATSDDECDLCQLLVKFADDYIRSNSTEEEIVKGLLDVCSILPSSIKDKCISIVNQYGTIIPGLIAELFSPLKVCEVLGLCSQDKLGVSLCSRGPAAWCANMENAKLCNAVSHCQRHVWN